MSQKMIVIINCRFYNTEHLIKIHTIHFYSSADLMYILGTLE